jgi:hypothetical protein
MAGYTTWLEEGVAVEFSIHAQMLFGLPLQQPEVAPVVKTSLPSK